MPTDNLTDPIGRLADLARHVVAETQELCSDPELSPLNRRRAMELQAAALIVASRLDGYTEMPDAKRERLER